MDEEGDEDADGDDEKGFLLRLDSSFFSLNMPVGLGEMGMEVARRTAAAPPAGGVVSGSRLTRSNKDPAWME